MPFELLFTAEADKNLTSLENDKSLSKRLKAVNKALGYLEINPRHPSLNTHEFTSLSKQFGTKIYEAYAENNTPCAYRIFWHYGKMSEYKVKRVSTLLSECDKSERSEASGSDKDVITIIAITPHP